MVGFIKRIVKTNTTKWESSTMPIKDDPLCIEVPAKVHKAEAIEEDQNIIVKFGLKL